MSSSIDSEQEAIIKESSLYDEIAEWWFSKVDRYTEVYAQRHNITVREARRRLFTDTHEEFLVSVPTQIYAWIVSQT